LPVGNRDTGYADAWASLAKHKSLSSKSKSIYRITKICIFFMSVMLTKKN